LVPDRDVRAAALRLARRAELEPERRETLVEQLDHELGQGDALRSDRLDTGLGDELRADLDRDEPGDRRRAGEEAADPVDRVVRRPHRELLALSEPAP